MVDCNYFFWLYFQLITVTNDCNCNWLQLQTIEIFYITNNCNFLQLQTIAILFNYKQVYFLFAISIDFNFLLKLYLVTIATIVTKYNFTIFTIGWLQLLSIAFLIVYSFKRLQFQLITITNNCIFFVCNFNRLQFFIAIIFSYNCN